MELMGHDEFIQSLKRDIPEEELDQCFELKREGGRSVCKSLWSCDLLHRGLKFCSMLKIGLMGGKTVGPRWHWMGAALQGSGVC